MSLNESLYDRSSQKKSFEDSHQLRNYFSELQCDRVLAKVKRQYRKETSFSTDLLWLTVTDWLYFLWSQKHLFFAETIPWKLDSLSLLDLMFPHREVGCTGNKRFWVLFQDKADSHEGKICCCLQQREVIRKRVHNYICNKLSLHFLRNFHLHSAFALLSHSQAAIFFWSNLLFPILELMQKNHIIHL